MVQSSQNWAPDGTPAAADSAILNINQTINLTSFTQVGFFQQTNGTLTSLPGVTFTVLHDFLWSGGTMSGAGVTNANGGLLMDSGLAMPGWADPQLARRSDGRF